MSSSKPLSKLSIENLQTDYRHILDSIDIELILMFAVKKSREFILAHPEYILSEQECAQTISLLERRRKREPIAYILGHKEFYGLDFLVNQHTLIPRPETELMIDEALKIFQDQKSRIKNRAGCNFENTQSKKKNKSHLVIDIGTGSGNIIITLAKKLSDFGFQRSDFNFFGVDISPDALAVAQENATRHGIENRVTFLQSNLLETFFHNTTLQSYNHILLLANLPYLSEEIYRSAEPDVKEYEPITALVSDEAGLAHYRKLLEHIAMIREKNIFSKTTPLEILIEISPEQQPFIENLVHDTFPKASVAFICDYSQRFRFVKISLAACTKSK